MRPAASLIGAGVVLLSVVGLVHDSALAAPAKKRALVIGNGAYQVGELSNPAPDARAVAERLRTMGFGVVEALDLRTKTEMRSAVNRFVKSLGARDLVLVYYAGHAIELGKKNYLLPVGVAPTNPDDAAEDAYELGTLLARITRQRAGNNIVVLDACRASPFPGGWSSGPGLRVPKRAPPRVYIAFSTTPGAVADDGVGQHSPYTEALLEVIDTPDLDVDILFRRVRARVLERTGGKQDPWSKNGLLERVMLVGGLPSVAPKQVEPPAVASSAGSRSLELGPREATSEDDRALPRAAWFGLSAAAIAGGVVLDLAPSTARNQELDGLDVVPVVLYAAAAVLLGGGVFGW